MSDNKFKISGTISAAQEVKRGKSNKGEWVSQTFTVKENGQHPQEVQVNYMKSGEGLKYFNESKVGDAVEVEFNITQREFNGKTFNSVSVWSMKNDAAYQRSKNDPRSADNPDDLPF